MFTQDGQSILLLFESPRQPNDIWRYDLVPNTFTQLTHSLTDDVDTSAFVIPDEVWYPSLDGVLVPAMLYRPRARTGRALVNIHGGPNWLFQRNWYPFMGYMAEQGWTVLAPNYRGSTCYGRTWTQANYMRIGEVDTWDCAAGAQYLVREKLAEPDKIVVSGRSHGGYLTMCCLTEYPELWAGGSAVGFAILALFAVIFMRMLRIAALLPENQVFERLLLIGSVIHLFIQVFYMVGGTLNLVVCSYLGMVAIVKASHPQASAGVNLSYGSSGPQAGSETTRLHFVYDAWNRLVQVKADSGGSPGATIATYRYHGRGYRIQKVIAGGDTWDCYQNERNQTIEVRKNSDTDAYEQYVFDQRYIDTPVMVYRDTNTDGTVEQKLYVAQDANFDVTATINGTSGAVVNRFVYTPYGQRTVLSSSWNASTTDFVLGHQGLVLDTESSLYYNRARYYHPTLGRFLQRDPLEYRGGLNLYQYVGGRLVCCQVSPELVEV